MTIRPAHLLVAALLMATPAAADREAINRPMVTSSKYGNCYGKSVPAAHYEDVGTTSVYMVRDGPDELVHSFDWFARQLWLECSVAGGDGPVAVSVVRMGRWPRGERADSKTLALEFYRDGKLLKRYSTLDIAGRPDNVSASESHYTVIEDVFGYTRLEGNRYDFRVTTIDGRTLRFDVGTGELLS